MRLRAVLFASRFVSFPLSFTFSCRRPEARFKGHRLDERHLKIKQRKFQVRDQRGTRDFLAETMQPQRERERGGGRLVDSTVIKDNVFLHEVTAKEVDAAAIALFGPRDVRVTSVVASSNYDSLVVVSTRIPRSATINGNRQPTLLAISYNFTLTINM